MAPTKSISSELRKGKLTQSAFSKTISSPNGNLETITNMDISTLESIETVNESMRYLKPQFIWELAKHKSGLKKYLGCELLT